MTSAAKHAPDDDDQLPALAPLDTDEGVVEVPDELRPEAWDEHLDGDDDAASIDPHALTMGSFDGDGGEDDEGSPDDPMDAMPEDDRGLWVGDDERGGDDVAEVDEPTPDAPDGGEDGPTRDPYDQVDTALPALDDDDEGDGPAEGPSP
jgi:hypothetical protein